MLSELKSPLLSDSHAARPGGSEIHSTNQEPRAKSGSRIEKVFSNYHQLLQTVVWFWSSEMVDPLLSRS